MANKYLDLLTKNSNTRTEELNRLEFAKQYFLPDYNPVSSINGLPANFKAGVPDSNTLASVNTLSDKEIKRLQKKSTRLTKKGLVPEDEDITGFGFTAGDLIGLGSSVAGGIAEIVNTVRAAKATKKNVNRFKGFNEKSLAVNAQTEMQAGINKNVAKRESERNLRLASNTQKKGLRNLSSGINQLKTNDMAVDAQITNAKIGSFNQLEDIYGKQLLDILGQRTQLLSQKDQMEMSAQERVDERDQQDSDNFYTNLATNIASLSEIGQLFGKSFNEKKYREDFLNILPLTNAWGIGIDFEKGINGGLDFTMKETPSLYSRKRGTTITED